MQQAYTRYVLRVVPERGKVGMQPPVDDLSMEIGYRYHSPAIIAEAGSGSALYEDPRHPGGTPGTRAPHVVLHRAGKPMSTFDLFTRNFCVLAAPDGGAWCAAARAAAAALRLPLDCHHVDRGDIADPENRFVATYGLSRSGAVIVRPDGFIAWRAKDATGASTETMAKALSTLLGRRPA